MPKYYSDEQLYEMIDDWLADNQHMDLQGVSASSIDDVVDVFNALMKEEVRKYDTMADNETLLHNLLEMRFGKDEQATSLQMLAAYGDNKHLGYFDMVLEAGESNYIMSVLAENNIPTSVLKGISASVPHEGVPIELEDGRFVQIYQDVEKPSPDVSPIVTNVEIYLDGKLIYSWKNRASKEIIFSKKTRQYSITKEEFDKASVGKTISSRTVITNTGKYREELWKTSKGNAAIRKRGAKGRFI